MKMPLEVDAKQPKTAANLQSSATKSSSVAPSNSNEQRSTRRSNAEKHNNAMSQVKNTAVKAQSSKVAPQPQNEVEPKDTQAAAKGVDTVMPTLNKEEAKLLHQHENVIRAGQANFWAVVCSLKVIHDKRLYKAEFTSFREYCLEKWGFDRAHGNRYVEAAAVYENLKSLQDGDNSVIPISEGQVRWLTRLSPDQQAEAWKAAVDGAEGAHITMSMVEAAVKELLPATPRTAPTANPKPKTQVAITELKAVVEPLLGLLQANEDEQVEELLQKLRNLAGIKPEKKGKQK